MKVIIFILIVCLAGIIPGQETATKTQQQTVTEKTEPEQEGQETGYVYKPAGRRDPFWDPLKGTKQGEKEKIAGIAGLTINEMTLEGILLINGAYQAQFRGPDNRPWSVKVGDMVYDGEVVKIDLNSVTFRQNLPQIMGGTRERIVVKNLNPEEEK